MRQSQRHAGGGVRDIRIGIGGASGFSARLLGSELFIDLLSCIILSAGCLTALLAATGLDSRLTVCLLSAVAAVPLTAVCGRRWWIAPALLTAAVAIYAAVCLITDGVAVQLAFWDSFFSWLASGAIYRPGSSPVGFLIVSQSFITLAVIVPIWLMIRRWFRFLLLLGATVGICLLSAVIYDTDLSAAVCVCAAGLIVLLPRVYVDRVAKKQDIGGATQKIARSRMQLVAVAAAALSILLSLLIIPEDTSGWRSRGLGHWLDDIYTKIAGPFSRPARMTSNFDLRFVGYSSETGRLGGPIKLNNDIYLSVITRTPALLRGRVYDIYDGQSWYSSSSDGDLRVNSPMWRAIYDDTFDLDKPAGGGDEAQALYASLTYPADFTIFIQQPAFTTLFLPGQPNEITMGSRAKEAEAYFNRRGEAYLHEYPERSMEYKVQARVWATDWQRFDTLFVQLEGLTSDPKRYAQAVERYTQLPDGLPDSVREEAARFISDGLTPYQRARAISNMLSATMTYTLTPVTPPEGVDFVEHFLQTREGYCVYYATAMTVLARCAGLPARYVSGFALQRPERNVSNRYQATGRTAHAWSEIYFEGIGWLPFDPLSFTPDRPPQETPSDSHPGQTTDPEDDGPGQNPLPPLPVQPRQDRHTLSLLWLLLLIPAAAGAFVWVLWAVPRRNVRYWSYMAVRYRWGDRGAQLNHLYNDLLRLLSLHALRVYPGETLETFPPRIDRYIKLDGVTLSEISGAMTRLHFVGIPPEDDEIKRACRYHEQLELLTLERLGRLRYIIGRWKKS